MKIRQCYQSIGIFSLLAAQSPAAATPVPESYDASNTDYLPFTDGDNLQSFNTNSDEASIWNLDQSNQDNKIIPSGSTGSTNPLSSIDGTSIAWGDILKGPYCGTTELPVCCNDLLGFTDCKYCEVFFFNLFYHLITSTSSGYSNRYVDPLPLHG